MHLLSPDPLGQSTSENAPSVKAWQRGRPVFVCVHVRAAYSSHAVTGVAALQLLSPSSSSSSFFVFSFSFPRHQ